MIGCWTHKKVENRIYKGTLKAPLLQAHKENTHHHVIVALTTLPLLSSNEGLAHSKSPEDASPNGIVVTNKPGSLSPPITANLLDFPLSERIKEPILPCELVVDCCSRTRKNQSGNGGEDGHLSAEKFRVGRLEDDCYKFRAIAPRCR